MNETTSLNYEMFTANESDFDTDILSGITLDILLLLQSESRTSSEISRKLNIPIFMTQVYLNRLLNANFIEVQSVSHVDGKIEKLYSLAYKNIAILNKLNVNSNNITEEKKMQTIQYFNSITMKAIQQAVKEENMPHKIKAHYIRTKSEKMQEFIHELNLLFEKYENLEDEDGGDVTYSLFTILAPVEE